MFEWLRTKNEFMAVITDDHFTPDEKLAEYNRVLVGYKFNLRRRNDLTKALLFIKMLDDNAAQFLGVFVEGVAEAEEQGQTFDFSGEGGQADEEGLDMQPGVLRPFERTDWAVAADPPVRPE